MSTAVERSVERTTFDDIVANWRTLADTPDNPAGPLYQAGDYTEADITMTGDPWYTPLHCSRTYDCTRTETAICVP
jgi:hypothetical protein